MKKMSATQTEILGLGEIVSMQLVNERTALERGGMNVDVTKAILDLAVEEARAANTHQESLKHQLTTATKITVAKMERAYVVISGTIDAMMAAVGKNSNIAKVFGRLRSRIRQPGEQDISMPPSEPVGEATE